MEKQGKMLSLGEWPTRPHNRYGPLSPITKRILNQVHIDPQDIMPLAFQQFLQNHTRSSHNKEQLQEYYFQVGRRKKQASILGQIRTAYILGKDYGVKGKQKKESRKNIKSRSKSKEYESQLKLQSVRSKSKISRQYSRASSNYQASPSKLKTAKSSRNVDPSSNSKKEESDYFLHFDPRKTSHHKPSHQDESTGIHHHQKSKIVSKEHQEYGLMGNARYSKIRHRKDSSNNRAQDNSRELCEELVKTVEAWEQLEARHLKEIVRAREMSSRERQRLVRMQSMERQAISSRVRGMKERLRSEGL